MLFPHPLASAFRNKFDNAVSSANFDGLANITATLGSFYWLGFETSDLSSDKKRLAWLGAQRLMCWHRRILKGGCHEIEVLTPVDQPWLVGLCQSGGCSSRKFPTARASEFRPVQAGRTLPDLEPAAACHQSALPTLPRRPRKYSCRRALISLDRPDPVLPNRTDLQKPGMQGVSFCRPTSDVRPPARLKGC